MGNSHKQIEGSCNLMGTDLVGKWWAIALRGLAAILLGIAAFVWPGLTLVVLVILFGAYLLVDGVLALVAGGMTRSWLLLIEGVASVIAGILTFVWPSITAVVLLVLVAGGMTRSWLLLIEGVASVIAGILTFVWPSITAVVLLVLVAAWAIITGLIEVYAAIRLRRLIRNEWLLILGGVASIIFGVLLVVNPRAGLLALTWLVGAYALIFGVLLVALAFRLRTSRRGLDALRPSI
jgi:uncharacterized membrane protein HdeD (DUF308 family)